MITVDAEANKPKSTDSNGQSPIDSTNRTDNSRGNSSGCRGGHGRSRGRGRGNFSSTSFHPWNTNQWWSSNAPLFPTPWACPSCPYSTTGWPRPNSGPPSPGILGPRPQQAHIANTHDDNGYNPTDIDSAIQTMSLHVLDDLWFMDTGASSHMTSSSGTLSLYNKMISHNSCVAVGNDNLIPIHGFGQCTFPSFSRSLSLNNTLHVSAIVKNLVYVRKFITDNNVTVEFDPYGFSVKDIPTGTLLLRCNSNSPLYPVTTSTRQTALSTISPQIWHNQLGHPGRTVFQFLKRNNCIPYVFFDAFYFVFLRFRKTYNFTFYYITYIL